MIRSSLRRLALLAVAITLAGAFRPSPASAALITFEYTGTGSGSIAGNPFTDGAFTITATADTVNREVLFFVPLVVGGYSIDHDTASISIAGVGDFEFVTGTRTFVTKAFEIVGFARDASDGFPFDLYDGPVDPAFATWDMLSSIGPIAGATSLLQWIGVPPHPVITDGGQLIFNDSASSGSFRATVVPEPSVLALLGIGAVALAKDRAVLRRRRA